MSRLLILFNIFITLCSANNKFFTKHIIQLETGKYTLTPSNYSYNPQIIIEMWGVVQPEIYAMDIVGF